MWELRKSKREKIEMKINFHVISIDVYILIVNLRSLNV